MTANLPANGTVHATGRARPPRTAKRGGAHFTASRPSRTRSATTSIAVLARSQTIVYRLPEPKKPAKGRQGRCRPATVVDAEPEVVVKIRPDLTQKGLAMVGDFRTDALHEALNDAAIPLETLVGLLVLALGAKNVAVQSPLDYGRSSREDIRDQISEGGVLTADPALLHSAAREMLKFVLSCRANMTDSGVTSRIAGETLGAATHLPTMATDEFLSLPLPAGPGTQRRRSGCESRDPREGHPGRSGEALRRQDLAIPRAPLFPLSEEEREQVAPRTTWVGGTGGGGG